VTEVPEHLLQRSRERRQALGLPDAGQEGGAAEAPAPAASAPAAAPAAAASAAPAARPAPAPAAAPEPPPPPKPLAPYVVAAQTRKRIPIWAMPVLAGLPLWAFIFATTLSPPGLGENDPLMIGREIYAGKCASCHGAAGGGGVGPALTNGDVLLTFPDPLDHIAWVEGGEASAAEDGTYGDPSRAGGQRNVSTFAGRMPAFGTSLSPEEIAAVVRYEREVLSGAEPEPELTDPEAATGDQAGGDEGGDSSGGAEQQGSDTGTPTTADDGTGSGSDDVDGTGGETDTEGGESSTEDTTGTGGG
jgi:mono/diheme cytochrome c family protein